MASAMNNYEHLTENVPAEVAVPKPADEFSEFHEIMNSSIERQTNDFQGLRITVLMFIELYNLLYLSHQSI